MLTADETKNLVELLRKIDYPHIGVSQEIFNALVKIVPYVACELAISNSNGEFLLTWREDEYWKGWHFPGGLLRFRESFDERIQNVAREELGIHVANIKFMQVFNFLDDTRGHTVQLLFLCDTPDQPKNGEWFKDAPADILAHHRVLFESAMDALLNPTPEK